MFGYNEAHYTVDKETDVPTKAGGTQHFEVRQSVQTRGYAAPLPYIAVEGKDANGKLVLDLLYRYDSREKLERDWALLTSDVVVKSEDLDYVEMIVDHHTGHTKDGGIAMY